MARRRGHILAGAGGGVREGGFVLANRAECAATRPVGDSGERDKKGEFDIHGIVAIVIARSPNNVMDDRRCLVLMSVQAKKLAK